MPNSLSIDDFKAFSITCELRYKNAYLIFDRTGHVLEDLRRDSFTDIKISNAGPIQTTFKTAKARLYLKSVRVGLQARLTRTQKHSQLTVRLSLTPSLSALTSACLRGSDYGIS